MRRKLVVVITARASYSRFKTVLQLLSRRNDIDLSILLAASAAEKEYGDVERQMREDGIEISAVLKTLSPDDSLEAMTETTGKTLLLLGRYFAESRPDAVVTIADRYETLATAIAAAYQNIPLIHIQGGEVSGNIDEKVRNAISKLADLHIVCTQRARSYLIRMGENADRVFMAGCPSCDLAEGVCQKSGLSREMLRKYLPEEALSEIKENGYYVILMHAVTNEQAENLRHTRNLLDAAVQTGSPVLWVMPNVDAGSENVRSICQGIRTEKIHVLQGVDNLDFLELLFFSKGFIGNSSVGIRECSYMGVPAVNIGSRQFGRERGPNVIDCGYASGEILEAIRRIGPEQRERCQLYGDGHAAEKIAEFLCTCHLSSSKTLSYVFEPDLREQ